MPELATALREVVDASATPVTVDEVLGLPEAAPPGRRRWPLLAAAAAVVVLAGAAAVALRTTSDDATVVPPATTAVHLPDLEDCARRTDRSGGGCPVTDEQAAAMLGIPINEPDGIPEGWTLVYHDVRYWTDQRHPIADYNRAWFRDPTVADDDTCYGEGCLPDYVQVTIRRARPGELQRLPLIEGSRQWVAGGRHYRINSDGIDEATVDRIANSLA